MSHMVVHTTRAWFNRSATPLCVYIRVIRASRVVRPSSHFFHIYGWLVIIHGYFSAKPENRYWQINFAPENYSSYQIYFIPKTIS